MNEIGAAAFRKVKRTSKLSDDAPINHYVRCVASAILDVIPPDTSPGKDRWEVLVFEDPTPNAFAVPGGKIGIHTGMLKIASTPGRLAAVLGHEVAHVLLRHGNERMSQALLAEGVITASSTAVGVKAPRYQSLVVAGLGIGAQFGVLLPFSRKHESEADQIGQLFMARAGFRPSEAVGLWQAMAALDRDPAPQWQSTHPSDRNRIARLSATLPGSMLEFENARSAGKHPHCTPPGRSLDYIERIWEPNQR